MRSWLAAIACAALLTVPGYGAETKKEKKSADAKAAKPVKSAPGQPIDLNTASQKDLEGLPGVGAATAKKIIAGRPYSSANDLAKAGVPAKTITAITPMVTVSPAAAKPAPAPKSTAAAVSAPSPEPAASGQAKASSKAASKPATPPPAPGMVWVNLDTKVYHKEGQRWFGNTKNGKYMTEADAIKAGYRASKE
jgi:hypothetical protein